MAVSDLSQITTTLTNLLEWNVNSLFGGAPAFEVTSSPPDRISDASNTINLYLYHVSEDQFNKNIPGPGNDKPNVATRPLALTLYYILTAHHESETIYSSQIEQRLMGYALRTFHSHPVVRGSLQLTNMSGILDFVMPLELRESDTKIKVILRPVTPEESINFWSAEQQRVTRLAAYYEARVILLEPEPVRSYPGRVLSIGQFVLQMGGVLLEKSRSLSRFDLPPGTGAAEQQILVEPARPALVTVAEGPPNTEHNEMVLLGSNLTRGDDPVLVLTNPRWSTLDPPIREIVLDMALNGGPGPQDWQVVFQTDKVTVRVGTSITFMNDEGNLQTLDMLPGFYTARVRVIADRQTVGGQLREIEETSQPVSFSAGPRLSGHGAPTGAEGRITVTIDDAFDLALPDLDVRLVVDGKVYERIVAFDLLPVPPPPDPHPNEGQFTVTSDSITFQPQFDHTVSGNHPLRLMVEGVDAQPFWIVIP